MRTITLNTKQQRGVEILTRLDAGALEVGAAAELLGVTPRQVRRLRARFRQEGFQAVIHSNLGCSPANRTDPALVERILAPVSYTHLRAHETRHDLVCRLLLEKKKKK